MKGVKLIWGLLALSIGLGIAAFYIWDAIDAGNIIRLQFSPTLDILTDRVTVPEAQNNLGDHLWFDFGFIAAYTWYILLFHYVA